MNYDNTNRGVLFKNDKDGNEARPDYKGTINVNGTEFELAAWIKSSKAGSKYMALSVQPKQAKRPQQATGQPVRQPANVPQFDDDLPNF